MARNCVRASTQYMSVASVIATAAPLTMAAWVKPTANSTRSYVFSIDDGTTTNFFNMLLLEASGTVLVQCAGTGSGAANTSVGAAEGAWNHIAGVFASSTSRSAYINGGDKVTNTTSAVPGTMTATYVGRAGYSTDYMGGGLAEVAAWAAALDDAEIAALAKGFAPTLIRPQSLIAYWPLFGNDSPEPDRWKNRYDLTLTNAPTKSDHPRIYYPVGVE